MPQYILAAQEASILEASAPTAAQIEAAFRRVTLDATSSWVGPHPRVTRVIATGSLRAWITRAAWVLNVGDGQHLLQDFRDVIGGRPGTQVTPEVYAQAIADAVSSALQAQSTDWTPVAIAPYAPAVNGSLTTFWGNGQASVARTRDAFPTMGGRLDPDDNPVGPNTPDSRPSTVGEGLGGLIPGGPQGVAPLTDLLKTVAVVAVIGSVMYLAWPVLLSVRNRSDVRGARRTRDAARTAKYGSLEAPVG